MLVIALLGSQKGGTCHLAVGQNLLGTLGKMRPSFKDAF